MKKKVSNVKAKLLCLFKNPNQCTLLVSGNTLSRSRSSSTFGCYSQMTEGGTITQSSPIVLSMVLGKTYWHRRDSWKAVL